MNVNLTSSFKLLKNDMTLYFVVFLFFFSLTFNAMFGFFAALSFLICGALILINNIGESYRILIRYKALLAIPILAIFSSLWSEVPAVALRGGIQLLITTVFSIVLICRVEKNVLLNCLAFSLLITMAASLISSRVALNGMTGEYSLIGVFASKNHLATHTALAVGVGVAVFFHTDKYRQFSRILGGVLLLFSVLVLFKAKSLGAIFSVFSSIILMYVFFLYQRKNITINSRFFVKLLFFMLSIGFVLFGIYALTQSFFDEFMFNIGKDPTLTGRTYIWERGIELILNKPILGSGYQSVFVINNIVAEDIWEYASVKSGAGFHFHNMFINLWVELGIIGLSLYLFGIFLLMKRISNVYRFIEPQVILSVFIFIFFLTQSFLEAFLLRQFNLAQFLVCLVWISFSILNRESNNVS